MTCFVGIDIAKYTNVASIYDLSSGELILDSLHFDNNVKGFNSLLSKLSLLNKSDIIIGFESTAHYHLNLFNYLTDRNFKCYLINPYVTARFRSVSLRKAKNDNIDSRAISQFLSFEYKNLLRQKFVANELRQLCLHRKSLKQNSTSLKIKLISYLDRVFPELESIVGKQGLNSKAIRAILKLYPTANSISKVRVDRLISLSFKASSNRYPQDKIRLIKETARKSVGYHCEALSIIIRQTIESLKSLETQIDEVESSINSNPLVVESPLHQIKGINNIEIAYIISAIIIIQHFPSAEKLVTYAGLNPICQTIWYLVYF